MFFGFVKLFFQKSLNPALFFLAQCCLFSSGFVGNGYGLCSIINGFQRVDLFGVSRNPEVGTFLYFKAGIPFGAGRDSKVYFLINDWNDVFCSAPDGVGLSVFGRLQILDDGFLVRFHHVQAGILEFLFDNADKFESGLVFCILTGTELAVGLDDVFQISCLARFMPLKVKSLPSAWVKAR